MALATRPAVVLPRVLQAGAGAGAALLFLSIRQIKRGRTAVQRGGVARTSTRSISSAV